jgi:probable HAF family extracellular repeat protein
LRGFLYSHGTYTTIDFPGNVLQTFVTGINASGEIVGNFWDNSALAPAHGFLYSHGTYTTIEPPGSTSSSAEDINASGDIVGWYTDINGPVHGFLYSHGTYTTIDFPDTVHTFANGINASGQITGFNFGNDTTGFLATPNGHGAAVDGGKASTDLAGYNAASAGVTLYAKPANQVLEGGNGNDVLIGGSNDTLIGGAGADTFVFNPNFGKETATDYNVNHDVIAFDHTLFSNDTVSQVLSQMHDTNAGAVIAVDAHDTVTLAGVTVAQLQAAQAAHVDWLHFF